MLHLLFPEASVDDAAAEVVHPLPLDDVIEDELPGFGGSQLTWRQKQWDCNVISAQGKCSKSNSSVFCCVSSSFCLPLPGTGATFSRATHRKSPTFSFLTSKLTPFLCSSLTSSCLRWWLPPLHRQNDVTHPHMTSAESLFVSRRLLLPGRLDEVDTENNLVCFRQKTSCARLPARCLGVSCVSRPASFSPRLGATRQPLCRPGKRRLVLFKQQEKKDERSFSYLMNTHCILSSSFSSSSLSLAVRSTTPGPPSSSSSSSSLSLLTSSWSSLLPRSAESSRSARAEPSSVREYLSEEEEEFQWRGKRLTPFY